MESIRIQAGQRFDVLDSFRGIAAIIVAVVHVPMIWTFRDASFIRASWLWVDFFFVLSGFVVTHAYWSRLSTGQGLRKFMLRRFARLWPLHMFCLVAMFVMYVAVVVGSRALNIPASHEPWTESFRPITLISNVLLIQSMGVHPMLSWNVPSWSISVEFYTYLVFGVLALCLGRRSLAAAAVAIVIGCLAYIFVRYDGNLEVTVRSGFWRCLAGFFAGHLVYRLRSTDLGLFRGGSFVELLTMAAVIGFISIAESRGITLAAPLVFGWTVWLFSFEAGCVSRVLRNRFLLWLGLLSYSIYMVNYLVAFAMRNAARGAGRFVERSLIDPGSREVDLGNALANDAAVLIYVVIVIAISAATYRFVEVPGQRTVLDLAGSIGRRLRPVPAAQTPTKDPS